MPNERKAKEPRRIEDQLQGWDLAAETEETAMQYVGYREGKPWSREEFFGDGAKDVKECTAEFLKEMNFNPVGKRMLDIGCGIGRMTRAFADIFSEPYGLDFSPKMIEAAKELNKDKPNLHFGVNNGVSLSIYEADFFDFCFSYIVFHHIRRHEVTANYIREIDRVLKPGGLFMFQVNTNKWTTKAFGWLPIHYRVRDCLSKIGFMEWYTRVTAKDRIRATIATKTLPVYYVSPKKLRKILDDTNLEIIKITGQNTRYTWYCGKKNPLS